MSQQPRNKKSPKKPDTNSLIASAKPAALEVTAYFGGLAVLRERRDVALLKGKNVISLGGLPTTFEEGSFTIASVEGDGKFKIATVSQNDPDYNTQMILQKSVGSTITLIEQTPQGPQKTTGVLHKIIGNQAILELEGGGVLVMPLTNKYELAGGIPTGLSEGLSLELEASVTAEGKFGINTLYKADGIAWKPRFEAFYDAAAEKLSRFACWVDLTNHSGAALENARLTLLAGYNRAGRGRGGHEAYQESVSFAAAAPKAARSRGARPQADVEAGGGSVESVGEQKLFVLPEIVTLPNGKPKAALFFLTTDVPVSPEYYVANGYYEQGVRDEELCKLPVRIRLRATNDKESNLGQALPSGAVQIFEKDSTGSLQETDGSQITDVAEDEKFKLDLRNPSKDLKATRKCTYFHQDPEVKEEEDTDGGDDTQPVRPLGHVEEGPHPLPSMTAMGGPEVGTPEEGSRRRRQAAEGGKKKKKVIPPRFQEEERETTVFNYKDKAVEVLVYESIPVKSEFLKKSQDFAEQADGSGTFKLTVPAKGSAKVSYRIKFRIN